MNKIEINEEGLAYDWLGERVVMREADIKGIYLMFTDQSQVIQISDVRDNIRGIVKAAEADLPVYERLFIERGYKCYAAVFGDYGQRVCFSDRSLLTNNGEYDYESIKNITMTKSPVFSGTSIISFRHAHGQEIYKYETTYPAALGRLLGYRRLSIPIIQATAQPRQAVDNYFDRYNRERLYHYTYDYRILSRQGGLIRLRHFKYYNDKIIEIDFKFTDSFLSPRAVAWMVEILDTKRSGAKAGKDHWGDYKDSIVYCTIEYDRYAEKSLPKINITIRNASAYDRIEIAFFNTYRDKLRQFLDELTEFID